MSSKKQALFISSLVILWYTANIGVLLLNKFLLSNYGFRFPIFLTMCHMSACAVLSYISIAFLKLVPLQAIKSRSQFLKIATLSVVFCASVVGGNISLRYLAVSFNQAVGATTPFFTALFAFFMTFKREAWVTYAALVPVVTGVVIELVEKGIGGLAELKQLYRDKFVGKSSQKMVEYLQSSVGIIHRNHAESITTYIKETVDEELEEDNSNSDVKPAQKKRLTFCVEGNISVGKTTFLQRIANETLELRDLVEIVPEPINKWQDVGPDHFNILDAFYAEPERYAYTFQNYVFVTRVMQERESSGGIKPLRLMERSVFSDRMVFVRAVHEANWMNEMEISIYDSWFDPVVSCLPGLIPDGFIYLRASPDTCHQRMQLRKRSEEGGVSLDYLRGLHEKHESWLFPYQSGNHGVLSVSKLPFHMDSSLHPDIRDRVFYLEGDHMHSSIQKVPALVLDCEPNIDFSKDIEAKRQYARQVAEFFEFVKKKKEVPSAEAGEGATSSQQQLLLPHHKGGLWVPGGKHFPESALKSLDFRRAMSSFMSG